MKRTLTMTNRLLSLRGRIDVADDSGAIVYEARGAGFAGFSRVWRVVDRNGADDAPLATMHKRLFAFTPTWDISTPQGDFRVRRRLLSMRRRYDTEGGPFDGAVIEGGWFDMHFEVRHGSATLATSYGAPFSMRDRHRTSVTGDSDGEWFVLVAMLVVQIDRRSTNAES